MLNVAVLGVTGYTGEDLVRILAHHPHAKVVYVSSHEDRAQRLQEIYPYLKGTLDLECKPSDAAKAFSSGAELFFLALPHTVSTKVAPLFLEKGKRVIDISADYRLKDVSLYRKHYGVPHGDEAHLKEAVYGLPELNRTEIKKARLIANPGCYPTAAILAILPLLKNGIEWKGHCVMDAKSGVTGAGRKATASLLFSEVNENFKAYKVLSHQHEPEIAQTMGLAAGKRQPFVFVPHLVPIDRGTLCTVYLEMSKPQSAEALFDVLNSFYKNEPFVQVLPLGRVPEVKSVRDTNQCHIGLAVRPETGMAVIISAIDNLGKGAAGQAVQNMNLMSGFGEKEGLR